MIGRGRYRGLLLAGVLGLVPGAAAGDLAAISAGGQDGDRVERLVSLVPAATETLFAIGAGARVVGVSSYDRWPPEVERLPRVGALIDPDTERILALRPDLVIVDPAQHALVRVLESIDVPTFVWPTAGLGEYFERLQALGARLGLAEEASRLEVRLRDELARVAAPGSPARRPSSVIVSGRRPGAFAEIWVNGGVGYFHELLELAGGDNLFGAIDLQGFKAGLEVLVADPPEVLIEVLPGDEPVDPAAIIAEWRGLPGFAETRVGVIADPGSLVPGPRMGRIARTIAAVVRSAERE